jgi:3-carboxy-cis,cis-muconate cycloisomerase
MPTNMAATIIDSVIVRNIFSTEAMRRVFSDDNRVQKYLDFAAALARAQARLGIIPRNAADQIARHGNVAELDFAKLEAETARVGYPALPVVARIVALCRAVPARLCDPASYLGQAGEMVDGCCRTKQS